MASTHTHVKVADVLAVICLVFCQVIITVATGCLENEVAVQYNVTFNICCTTCAAGSGVEVECTPREDTYCVPCVSGRTYSDKTSHEEVCKPCSTCGNNTLFVLHPCNITQDTICLCPEGSYYDKEADKCRFCDLCPAGWGASRRCSAQFNTICSPCEPNVTFSNKLDYYSQCEACSKCGPQKVMLQECMTTEDTICFSVNAGRPPAGLPRINHTTPRLVDREKDRDGDIFPLYCSALVLVVVGLVGYVIFKRYQRMRSKRQQKGPCAHEDIEYSRASGGDSGVYVENDSPKMYSYCLASRVRDMPMMKQTELEKIMSVPECDSWKRLAKELGYSSKRIAHLESKHTREKNTCFRHLLHDWERREVATVSRLIQCLRNVGREDAARVVYADTTEGRTQLLSKPPSTSQNVA